jgi:hypothetical protein
VSLLRFAVLAAILAFDALIAYLAALGIATLLSGR